MRGHRAENHRLTITRKLERCICQAWSTTLREEERLFDFTDRTTGTEWNIASHFAWRLRTKLPDYDCDIELLKGDFERRRPDIVLHRRGMHDFNFLVIEVKLGPERQSLDEDKIRQFWFAPPLSYAFGATIVLHREGCATKILENEAAPSGRSLLPPQRAKRESSGSAA